mmetsp:Transcript_14946/g.40108  ORF Transcript_14946/g.40108 Transcript_14946/m.40108 type:complete len:117 (+) Transcript_14946:162-512(+)
MQLPISEPSTAVSSYSPRVSTASSETVPTPRIDSPQDRLVSSGFGITVPSSRSKSRPRRQSSVAHRESSVAPAPPLSVGHKPAMTKINEKYSDVQVGGVLLQKAPAPKKTKSWFVK